MMSASLPFLGIDSVISGQWKFFTLLNSFHFADSSVVSIFVSKTASISTYI